MLKWLLGLFKKHDSRFPKKIMEHWYCGCWYMYLSDLKQQGQYEGTSLDPDDIESPARDQVAFNPFRTGHASRNKSGLIDGLIPAIRVDDCIGLYEQTGGKYRTTSNYDGAPWDDGYHIDLNFVRSIRKELVGKGE